MIPDQGIRKLSVVVPCFNEEGNVRRFEKELFEEYRRLPFPCEFVLVDDGSSDLTASLLKSLAEKNPSVVFRAHSKNLGMGAALRTGIAVAAGDAILTIDADLTFHPSNIDLLLAAYNPGVDCVTGSALLGRLEGVSAGRAFLSKGVNILYGMLLGGITSTSSVFRLYRASTLKVLELDRTDFDINAEILLKLLKRKGRVVEVPVTLTQRSWGQSKIRISREIRNHIRMLGRVSLWRAGLGR